jgi:hypothetical protein
VNVINWLRFMTEPSGSEDYDTSREAWEASKAAKAPEWRIGMLAPVAAYLILAVLVAALMIGLAGCGAPCDGHGGIREYIGNSIYICNDGTYV